MSSSKDINNDDLKKLEDEAYFELCQIIAEALEYQDVELLDARIASWKTKYKKLLDRPSTSSKSDFKKRIEYLLNQYYSQITQYILNKLRLREEEKVKNQAKAMRELYRIIKYTNDLDLLKKKVNKWTEKYPVSGFLKMYKKRIELYTREKNLKENAFKQEEAFSKLVDITKINGTIDELKNEVEQWEKEYSINDKFTIDDFIKHQSEVKRFTSDEFLQSIARKEPEPNDAKHLIEEYNNKPYSSLSVQESSYKRLISIAQSPNNVNEMFIWVYKNSHVKFNDNYKELILRTIYLNYSPAYLNKMPKPKLNSSNNSLSYDEFTNIDDIKRYAIISYFNLLLPPSKAVSNDCFNKYIQVIYSKSEKARVSNNIENDTTTYIEDIIHNGEEIPLTLYKEDENSDKKIEEFQEISEPEEISDNITEILDKVLESPQISDDDIGLSTDNKNQPKEADEVVIISDPSDITPTLTLDLNDNSTEKAEDFESEIATEKIETSEPEVATEKIETSEPEVTTEKIETSEPEVTYDTVVALSPLLFTSIYTHVSVVDTIDKHVTEYTKSETEKESSYGLDKTDTIQKTKNNMD